MPFENFRLIENDPLKTLQRWARQLNYFQKYIDPANIEKAEAISVTISDTGNYYASTSVEMALNELGSRFLSITASTVGINDTGGYYVSTSVEGALQEIGSTLRNFPASTVGINDTGGYFTSTQVENAFQEIGNRLYGYLEVSATTGAGASTFALTAPFQGKRFAIYCSAANSSDKAITYTGSTATFFGPGAMLRINFTEAGQAVDVIGVSTSRWAILSMGSTLATAALPTLST